MATKKKPAIEPELRRAIAPIRNLVFRDAGETGDGSITSTGYAAVFDEETVLLDVGWWRLREVIAPGAFDDVLSRDPLVHLVHEHDNRSAMAATDVDGIGGLELTADHLGLRWFARLDPDDIDVKRVTPKLRNGYVKQASFAFRIAPDGIERHSVYDEDGNEDELMTITRVSELYDVSICAQGAYPQTSAEISRALRNLLGRTDPVGLNSVADPGPGASPVAPDTPVGGDHDRVASLLALRARARNLIATTGDPK